jgi:hypothetical protein
MSVDRAPACGSATAGPLGSLAGIALRADALDPASATLIHRPSQRPPPANRRGGPMILLLVGFGVGLLLLTKASDYFVVGLARLASGLRVGPVVVGGGDRLPPAPHLPLPMREGGLFLVECGRSWADRARGAEMGWRQPDQQLGCGSPRPLSGDPGGTMSAPDPFIAAEGDAPRSLSGCWGDTSAQRGFTVLLNRSQRVHRAVQLAVIARLDADRGCSLPSFRR